MSACWVHDNFLLKYFLFFIIYDNVASCNLSLRTGQSVPLLWSRLLPLGPFKAGVTGCPKFNVSKIVIIFS